MLARSSVLLVKGLCAHRLGGRGLHACALLQVSADGEEVLYKACQQAGITMLSIGHRPALRKYHQMIVHFDGAQSGRGWRLEEVC